MYFTDFTLCLDTGSSGDSSGVSSGDSSGGSDATAAERNEIVDKHNALRRGVQPSASNMLKMVTHGHVHQA